MQHCLYVLISSILFAGTLQHLHSALRHFEILTPAHLRTRTRREAASMHVLSKTITFHAFGRRFLVYLEPGSPVIDPDDLEVRLILGNGSGLPLEVNMRRFYVGRLANDMSSTVDAVYVAGTWSMFIQGHQNLFIEPLQKHDGNGRARHMVIYRQTDIRMGNVTRSESSGSFCKVVDATSSEIDGEDSREETWSRFHEWSDNSESPFYGGHLPFHSINTTYPFFQYSVGGRSKRESVFYFNTCDMLAIMDTAAFRGVGGGSTYKSAALLVYWYQIADTVFKKADFGFFKGMRLKLRAIHIMTEFTPSAGPHFNRDPELGQINSDEVLSSMSNETWFNQYCLAHLTTQRKFRDSLLGLATTANVPIFDPGDYRYKHPYWKNGICASSANNIALSCIQQEENILTDATYIIVMVHEIAHGWGAMHDDHFRESECDPRESEGGKYIMWSSHNGGKDLNSFKFSICSASSIQEVLFYKAHRCFLPAHLTIQVCGNSVVEYPEQCDEGKHPNSVCCAENCRLKDDAVCSPYNHPCCNEKCRSSPVTQRCYPPHDLPCVQPSYCDGVSHLVCPDPMPLPDGHACEDHGTCLRGRCLSYCENKGRTSTPPVHLQDCTCDNDIKAMCAMCCKTPSTNSCVPYPQPMSEGMPCLLGFCRNGECVGPRAYSVRSAILGAGNTFFMRNLVFLVILLSLPLSLIVCCCLWYLDCFSKTKRLHLKDPYILESVITNCVLIGKREKGQPRASFEDYKMVPLDQKYVESSV